MKQIKINVSNEEYKLLCKHILFLKNINTQGKTYKNVSEEDITGILTSIWKQSNITELLNKSTDGKIVNGSKSK